MKWAGKLVALVLFLIARRPSPIFLLVLLGLGHLYDMGVFSGAAANPSRKADPPPPTQDPYAALGVNSSASDDEIEQAYRRKMSEYHPDRVANAADEIKQLAEQRAREINAAYDTIRQQRRKG